MQNPVSVSNRVIASIDWSETRRTVASVVNRTAATTANWLREQDWVCTVAKLGWTAKGIVYAAIGWAAIVIAVGRPGRTDAEYTGIVALLSGDIWSRLVLGAIAAGLALYIAFRVISVLLIDSADLDAWAHRLGYSVSAATYVTVAWAALDAAVTGTHHDDGSTLERSTAELLVSVPGRLLVGAGGLVALGIAAYFAYKGVTRRFLRQLDTEDLSDLRRAVLAAAGAVGWVGRGAVVAAVALFVIGAAAQADPADVRGLDRSMQEVAVSSDAGSVTVFVIGVLLLLYAGFCALSAPYRSLAWSDRNDPEEEAGAR